MKTCANHSEKKAHRHDLCKSCYERFLRERDPEYAARTAASAQAWAEQNRERNQRRSRDADAAQKAAKYREIIKAANVRAD